MCRMAAFVAKEFKKNDILDMLLDMEGARTGDGVGYALVSEGKFIYKKTTLSLTEILKKKSKSEWFGDCFNHNSWVIFHSRKASPGGGGICSVNAHPFMGRDNAFMHNGLLKNHELIKATLGKDYKYTSGTDSEVALNLYEKIGARKFTKLVDDSGVFVALNRNGELTVIKSNFASDMKFAPTKNGSIFLMSEFPTQSDYKEKEMEVGVAVFDVAGKLINFKEKEKKVASSHVTTYTYPKKTIEPIDNHSETFGHHKSIHEMGDLEWFNENRGHGQWNPYAHGGGGSDC